MSEPFAFYCQQNDAGVIDYQTCVDGSKSASVAFGGKTFVPVDASTVKCVADADTGAATCQPVQHIDAIERYPVAWNAFVAESSVEEHPVPACHAGVCGAERYFVTSDDKCYCMGGDLTLAAANTIVNTDKQCTNVNATDCVRVFDPQTGAAIAATTPPPAAEAPPATEATPPPATEVATEAEAPAAEAVSAAAAWNDCLRTPMGTCLDLGDHTAVMEAVWGTSQFAMDGNGLMAPVDPDAEKQFVQYRADSIVPSDQQPSCAAHEKAFVCGNQGADAGPDGFDYCAADYKCPLGAGCYIAGCLTSTHNPADSA